jgi:hypothetical protein
MTSAMKAAILSIVPVLMVIMVVSPALPSYSTTSTADLNQTQGSEELGIAAGTESIREADREDSMPLIIVSLLANELETRLNKSGAILEITSRLPEVNSVPFADSISPDLHGIPEDADIPKRKVAQDILAVDEDFQLMYFLMPNGDIYFEEPYSRQENLTVNNLAFRDYFQRVLETGDTYLSDVYPSASTVLPQASIVVPIYSEENDINNNATLIGLWVGGLNLTSVSKSLHSFNLTSADERIVYVDGQGQKIADSEENTANESFFDLQSFRNAITNGESGTITEVVNGTTMLVSYHPVRAFYNTWAVLFMQPYEDGSNSTNNADAD